MTRALRITATVTAAILATGIAAIIAPVVIAWRNR